MDLNKLANINKVLETDSMRIDKNIIKIRRRTFQISNISSISVYDEKKTEYPGWAFVAVIIGFLLLFAQSVLGIVLLMVGGLVISLIYSKNKVDKLCISLWMNNGETYSISSTDIDFLYKVASAIEHCMNENNGQCYIDFKAKDIKNCNFAIGDYNTVE